MSVDLRTRTDGDQAELDAGKLFTVELPSALDRAAAEISPGLDRLKLRPFLVDVEGERWSLDVDGGRAVIARGKTGKKPSVRLSREQLSGLVADQYTPMTFMTGRTLDMPSGTIADFMNWWLVIRAALDGRALYVPGSVEFQDSAGDALDLGRSFTPDDASEERSHFLQEAGFLHIRGVFTPAEMATISADMDRAAPRYEDGDGRSWWATTNEGERRVVRMQAFDEHSTTAAALLRDERFASLGDLTGDGHVHTGLEGNRIEALVKPIGVVDGISDVPWHKDCSLGRHSYECCSFTVGISVTGADAVSGQLRVMAGSHRALIWPALVDESRYDLPVVDLPTETGDVTVHLSCTLHMSQPPTEQERRVMYTSFRLPAAGSAALAAARARLRAVREGAYTTLPQRPATESS